MFFHSNKNIVVIQCISTFGIALFFTLFLSVPRGYMAGLVALTLGGLYYLLTQRPYRLQRHDKWMMGLLALVGAAGIVSALYHGSELREWDMPSRYLLVAPIVMMLLVHPPRSRWVWSGLILGCLSGAAVAIRDVYSLDMGRGYGYTGAIQFGNVALTMSVFCAAAIFGIRKDTPRAAFWRFALCVGVAAGFYASIISGSRGGWVAMPVVVLLFCAALVDKKNARAVCMGAVAVMAGLLILAVSVPSVKQRYDDAVSDLRLYQQGNAATSLGARFAIWDAAVKLISEKPLMGWSRDAYEQRRDQLIKEGEANPMVGMLANTHNSFVEILLFQGVFGFLCMCAMLSGVFVLFWKRLRSPDYEARMAALSGTCLISIYVIAGQTQIMFSRNNTLVFFLVAIAWLWAKTRRPAS
jgi:O-antigen ligase